MLKVGYGRKKKVTDLHNYQFYELFYIKIISKVFYFFFFCAFFLLDDSSIHDSQLQLTMIDENDDLLVLYIFYLR